MREEDRLVVIVLVGIVIFSAACFSVAFFLHYKPSLIAVSISSLANGVLGEHLRHERQRAVDSK
jgi:hypothetical protein